MRGVRLHDTGGWGCPHCEMPSPCMCEPDPCPVCEERTPYADGSCEECGAAPCPECGERMLDGRGCPTPEIH